MKLQQPKESFHHCYTVANHYFLHEVSFSKLFQKCRMFVRIMFYSKKFQNAECRSLCKLFTAKFVEFQDVHQQNISQQNLRNAECSLAKYFMTEYFTAESVEFQNVHWQNISQQNLRNAKYSLAEYFIVESQK